MTMLETMENEEPTQGFFVSAKFTESSAQKVSDVLKKSCETLHLPNCHVYETYPGLVNSEPRPLTRRQEQMVKWATFHGAAKKSLIKSMKSFSSGERTIVLTQALEGRLRSARDLINWAFDPPAAQILLSEFIEPYLTASFEAVSRAASGRPTN